MLKDLMLKVHEKKKVKKNVTSISMLIQIANVSRSEKKLKRCGFSNSNLIFFLRYIGLGVHMSNCQ